MKKIVFLFGLLSVSLLNAQDLIVKKNTDEIKVKVIEVNEHNIKYREHENLEGPLYTINKNDILFIKYENGKKDTFKQTSINESLDSKKQNLTSNKQRFNYYNANFGFGSHFKVNFVELNIAVNIRLGWCFKMGKCSNCI